MPLKDYLEKTEFKFARLLVAGHFTNLEKKISLRMDRRTLNRLGFGGIGSRFLGCIF